MTIFITKSCFEVYICKVKPVKRRNGQSECVLLIQLCYPRGGRDPVNLFTVSVKKRSFKCWALFSRCYSSRDTSGLRPTKENHQLLLKVSDCLALLRAPSPFSGIPCPALNGHRVVAFWISRSLKKFKNPDMSQEFGGVFFTLFSRKKNTWGGN